MEINRNEICIDRLIAEKACEKAFAADNLLKKKPTAIIEASMMWEAFKRENAEYEREDCGRIRIVRRSLNCELKNKNKIANLLNGEEL